MHLNTGKADRVIWVRCAKDPLLDSAACAKREHAYRSERLIYNRCIGLRCGRIILAYYGLVDVCILELGHHAP